MTEATKAPKAKLMTDELLARALKLRQGDDRPNWKQVAAAVGVKSDALLSKRVRERYGDEAVRLAPAPKAEPAKPATPTPAAKAPAKRKPRVKTTKAAA